MANDDRPVGPVIVRRRLGNELRRLREEANLRLDAVAAELEVSPSKISRIETGHSTAKTWDVRNLLTLYGVLDNDRRERILSWLADAKSQVWWQERVPDSDHEVSYYISLEAEARSMQVYCTPVLHSLLQTDDYERAYLEAALPELRADEIDRFLDVGRGRRSAVLGQAGGFELIIVVDEAVLYRQVGSDTVMRGQLQHLLELPDPVDMRVRPLKTGPHRAILSPFTIFSPRVPDLDPTVVAVEAALTDSHLERPEATSRYLVAFQELRETSLDQHASQVFIRSLLQAS